MEARLVTCTAAGVFQTTGLFETCVTPLANAAQPARFAF
jgi:protein-L-isoaspartate(D-aspartate) O-methyltransferase